MLGELYEQRCHYKAGLALFDLSVEGDVFARRLVSKQLRAVERAIVASDTA